VLRIPQGHLLLYVHQGFASIYEEEIRIAIERGVVVEIRVIDNREMKLDNWGFDCQR